MALIEPRTLKGFRDYLPEAMIPRERLIDTARSIYRSYGFAPIDTPALEYEEILTGKGGEETDKQLYRFVDHGGRKVALRFDLTVPLARFAAQYVHELGLPFKRYHIASVWRGENTQKGRYREFMQCDFDTIGSESIAVDIEAALVIHDLMRAIGFEDFTVRVNDRRILAGLLEKSELLHFSTLVLRAFDKLDKIGSEKVVAEIVQTTGVDESQARLFVDRVVVLRYIRPTSLTWEHDLLAIARLVQGSESGEQGIEHLRTLFQNVLAARVDPNHVVIDLSIARGLDYYTGTVYETVLGALPGIGSVCSGGRYDNLAQLYTKERLPGVGASLGLDRLLAAMEELNMIEKRGASAPVFLPFFDAAHLADYLKLAARLRAARIGVELYPEPKKLGAQLKYADRRGFRFALIVGGEEWRTRQCQVKNLASGEMKTLAIDGASGELDVELVRALSSSH